MFNYKNFRNKVNMRTKIDGASGSSSLEKIADNYQKGVSLIMGFIANDCLQDGNRYYMEDENQIKYSVPALFEDDVVVLEYKVFPNSQPQLRIFNDEHETLAKKLKTELFEKASIDCYVVKMHHLD